MTRVLESLFHDANAACQATAAKAGCRGGGEGDAGRVVKAGATRPYQIR